MSIQIDIPESITSAIRLPAPELEACLRTELAIALYAQELLSFGKACELAGMSRFVFGELVAGRNTPRHYSPEDLAEDFKYARS